jgi:hypothetical protein
MDREAIARMERVEALHQAVSRDLGDNGCRGEIRAAHLEWTGSSPQLLAESRFLSVVVDRDRAASRRIEADVELTLERDCLRVHSLFGYLDVTYPGGWVIAVNRPQVESWWGAHRMAVFASVGVVAMVGLCVCWIVLAVPYSLVARFVGFWFDARLTWAGAWRLSSAALLPGALVMAGAIFLYGGQRLNLVGLLLALPLHLVVGWGYLLVAPARLPRRSDALTKGSNPFRTSTDPGNPFSPPAGGVGQTPRTSAESPPSSP